MVWGCHKADSQAVERTVELQAGRSTPAFHLSSRYERMIMAARSISSSELRPADILVTTGRSFISGAIRTTTGSDYSHTILYIGKNRVIEAIREGVVERDLSDPMGEATLAVALRRRHMTDQTRKFVVKYAKDFLSKPYDYVGAAGAGLSHKRGQLVCVQFPVECRRLVHRRQTQRQREEQGQEVFLFRIGGQMFRAGWCPLHRRPVVHDPPCGSAFSSNLLYIGHLVGGPRACL